MKIPEFRMSTKAAMPSSVHCWLGHELEVRGIDSMVYTRYIISLLQQDSTDLDFSETDIDLFWSRRSDARRMKGKKHERKRSFESTEEERKKNAAVKCLLAVSEEDNGIESLIEELCMRLKEFNSKDDPHSLTIDVTRCEDEGVITAVPGDPAERYYAAFPALQSEASPSQLSPTTLDDSNVWKKKHLASQRVKGSIEKNTEVQTTSSCPREKTLKAKGSLPKKTAKEGYSRENIQRRMVDITKSCSHVKLGGCGHTQEVIKHEQVSDWSTEVVESIKNQKKKSGSKVHINDERFCIVVENMLKELLLSSQEKCVAESEDKSWKNDVSDSLIYLDQGFVDSNWVNEDYVAPGFQEDDAWYQDPFDVTFNHVSNTQKQRLYKRHSYPPVKAYEHSKLECFPSSLSPFIDTAGKYSDVNRNIAVDDEEKLSSSDFSLSSSSSITSSRSATPNSRSVLSQTSFQSLISSGVSDVSTPLPTDPEDVELLPINSAETFLLETISDLPHDKQEENKNRAMTDSPPSVDTNCVSLLDLTYLSRFFDDDDKCLEDSWIVDNLPSVLKLESPDEQTGKPGWQNKLIFNLSWGAECTLEDNFLQGLWKGDQLSKLWNVNLQRNSALPSNYYSYGVHLSTSHLFPYKSEDLHAGTFSLLPWCDFDLAGRETDNFSISDVGTGDTSQEDNAFFMDLKYSCIKHSKSLWEQNQSCSVGDMQEVWNELCDRRLSKPKSFCSFELVPSDCSAFQDVIPKKIHHVRSEPILSHTFFSQVAGANECSRSEGSASSDDDSPDELLYFSPKTHFRPIKSPASTPADEADFSSDLFGGHSSTSKTPYQHYQGLEAQVDSSIGFVPKFKLQKDTDKYIQTGDSVDGEPGKRSEKKDLHYLKTKCQIHDLLFEDMLELEKIAEEVCTENEKNRNVESKMEKSSEEYSEIVPPYSMQQESCGRIWSYDCDLLDPAFAPLDSLSCWGTDSTSIHLPSSDLQQEYSKAWSSLSDVESHSWLPDTHVDESATAFYDFFSPSCFDSDNLYEEECLEWNEPVELSYGTSEVTETVEEPPALIKASTGFGNLMPLPSEAIYSSELEREWLKLESTLPAVKRIQKVKLRFMKKPCSFFLEGNCRRSDCRFAHDISNITCRFWEEEECFKGDSCPFLHGYPSDSDCGSTDGVDFKWKKEDFPELPNKQEKEESTKPLGIKHKMTRRAAVESKKTLDSIKQYRKALSLHSSSTKLSDVNK